MSCEILGIPIKSKWDHSSSSSFQAQMDHSHLQLNSGVPRKSCQEPTHGKQVFHRLENKFSESKTPLTESGYRRSDPLCAVSVAATEEGGRRGRNSNAGTDVSLPSRPGLEVWVAESWRGPSQPLTMCCPPLHERWAIRSREARTFPFGG